MVFQSLWDGAHGTQAQMFINAGETQGLIYAQDEDQLGFVGKINDVKQPFSHSELVANYSLGGRLNHLYDIGEDCANVRSTLFPNKDATIPLTNQFNCG